jgi:hypothetical protein
LTFDQLRHLSSIESPRREFFQGTQSDAIGLSKGPIDRSGLGHAHLGIVEDQRRNITGVGIAIADETAAFRGLVNGGFEDPEVLFWTTEGGDRLSVNPFAMEPVCHVQEITMGNIRWAVPRQECVTVMSLSTKSSLVAATNSMLLCVYVKQT